MKIAILTSVFFQKTKETHGEDRIIFGGAERYLVELCKFLQEEGHHVVVYQAIAGTQVVHKEYQGIQIVCLPVQDKWEYHTAPMLNQAFHSLTVSADLRIYFASFLAWPKVKSPCISINHGVFWDYPESLIKKITPEQRSVFFERQIYGMTAPDACVAVDTNVRNTVAAMQPGEERKIHYIPNFVDIDEFQPANKEVGEKIKILFPRRLSPLRGVNEFMAAAAELPEYEFIVCGQAFDKETEESLKQQAKGKNIRAIMRPMEEMAEVYREADIAVIPTLAAEGTSLSCLEAMATGLPIITTPAGGLPNLVIDRWNGLVVDLNHDTLTNAIKTLAEDEDTRARYGERNCQMAQECFSLEIWKERWREVLNKVF